MKKIRTLAGSGDTNRLHMASYQTLLQEDTQVQILAKVMERHRFWLWLWHTWPDVIRDGCCYFYIFVKRKLKCKNKKAKSSVHMGRKYGRKNNVFVVYSSKSKKIEKSKHIFPDVNLLEYHIFCSRWPPNWDQNLLIKRKRLNCHADLCKNSS